MSADLSIRDLHVSIGDKEILKGLSLDVSRGEVHAIMGPNGSGKSTLAGVLAGRDAYQVTGGSVEYLGRDLLSLAPEERAREGIFLAFQYPVEIPGISNVHFLKAALNAVRKHRGLEELDALDFLALVREKTKIVDLKLTPENFGQLISIVAAEKINSSAAQTVLAEMIETGADPEHIITEKNLAQLEDESEIENIAKKIVADNPGPAEDYKKGKENALQCLVGQTMKETKGKVHPQKAMELLKIFRLDSKRDELAGSLKDAERIFCYTKDLGWDAAAALAPLGDKASTHDDLVGAEGPPASLLAALPPLYLLSRFVAEVRTFGCYRIFPDALRQPQKPSRQMPLHDHGGNLTSVLQGMRRSDPLGFGEVVAAMGTLVPATGDARVTQTGGYLALRLLHDGRGHDHWFSASQESDGTLRMLGILAALRQDPSPGLIAIEEPELAIHPGALPLLREFPFPLPTLQGRFTKQV